MNIKYILSYLKAIIKPKAYMLSIFLITLSVIITYPHFFRDLLNSYWVNPIVSHLPKGIGTLGNIAFFLICTYYYYEVFKKEKCINRKRSFTVLFLCFCTFLCKQSDYWFYYPQKPIMYVFAFAHLIYLVGLFEFIIFIKHKRKEKSNSKSTALLYDFPIENLKSDRLNRSKYATTVSNTICENFSDKGSFCMGIVGSWGSGKSSFMNLIKENTDKKVNIVSIKFNVWSANSPSEIISEFFGLYKSKISPYSPNLSSKIESYAALLIHAINPDATNWFEKVKSIFKEPTGQALYDNICSELLKSQVNVLVYIDDLDRLRDTEILEVLKLIRNTVNFPYTQFIVAYDKDYITKCLTTKQITNPTEYIEKVFNCEIQLPADDRNRIVESLKGYLKIYLGKKEEDIRDNEAMFYIRYNEEAERENQNLLIPSLLKSERNVIRFANSFSISINYFKDNQLLDRIVIRDFFYLELLRFCFFDTYQKLRNTPLELVNFEGYESVSINEGFNKENKAESESKTSQNEQSDSPKVVRKPEDILLNELFPTSGNNNPISIANYRNFSTYFVFSTDPKCLTSSELLMALELEDLDSIFKDWSRNKYPNEIEFRISEYIYKAEEKVKAGESTFNFDRLYNFAKKAVANSGIAEEVVEGMSSHIKGLKVASIEQLCNLLDLWFLILKNERTQSILDDPQILNEVLYKDKLSAKLKREITDDDSTRINSSLNKAPNCIILNQELSKFITKHLREFPDDESNLVVSIVDLTKKRVSALQQYIDTNGEITEDFFYFLQSCYDSIDPNSHKVSLNKEALKIAREFVERKPQGFINLLIQGYSSFNGQLSTVYLHPYYDQIFEDNHSFKTFLYKDELSSMKHIGRVRNFWQIYEDNDYKPVEFHNQGVFDDIINSDFNTFIKKSNKLRSISNEVEELCANPSINKIDKREQLNEYKKVINDLEYYCRLTGKTIEMIDSYR